MIVQQQNVAIDPVTGNTLPDRYIEGTCPICGSEGARGDQCDVCGNQLDPQDLIDPVSKVSGQAPRFEVTDHYFLDVPALAEKLREWLDDVEATCEWCPNVIVFSKHLLEDVRPRAMTRDISWGIPVPGWED
ncbi:class I tRNA ligase family protein, partial [Pseudomonas sp. 71_D]|uniref:class I tRNA ligase family protein n=1 Tax=Pseudomonas sp. 71_D TaxID=2813564 RepID=UPI001FAFE2E7